MHWILVICILICSSSHNLVNGHGFGGDTYVRVSPGHWECIEQVVEHSDAQSVVSYHCDNKQCHSHKILARARSTTNCYFKLKLDDYPSDDIICSPLQQFYLPEKNCWVAAHLLQVGDVLLTEREGHLPITRITFVEQSLDLYALKIDHPHTFFVGRHSVLTHNMNLPVTSPCWELPLTITTLSAAGGCLTGFVTIASGIAVGAMAASTIYSAVLTHKAKKYHEVQLPKNDMILYQQIHNTTPKTPPQQNGKNNSGDPQKPDDKKPRCTEKIANMRSLFMLNEFGRQLKECSEGTKYLYENHTKIFRVIKDSIEYGLKKGYWFYLDTLHYDHIEVFSKSGARCVAVLNLDGSYNITKTAQAIKACRDIIEYIK